MDVFDATSSAVNNVTPSGTITLKIIPYKSDIPLHIIDHRSVMYLTLLQILLHNQQYVYDDSNNNSMWSVTVTSAVTMKIVSYELYVALYSVVSESSESSAIIMMTAPFYELPSAIYNGIPFAVKDRISSATSANETTYDYYYGDIAVLIASPSIVIDTESSTVFCY